jgi:hypothetical protein
MTFIVFFSCFFFVKKFQHLIEASLDSKPYRNLAKKAKNAINSAENPTKDAH